MEVTAISKQLMNMCTVDV